MKVEIKVHKSIDHPDPVLIVLLYTKDALDKVDIYDMDEGVYNCCCTLSNDPFKLTSIIEQAVNACIETYEMEKLNAIEKIIE